jgi:lysozyme
MRASQVAIDFIKNHEGFVEKIYSDTGENPTIGYGHRVVAGETFASLTEEEAYALLLEDIAKHEKCIHQVVTVPLTQSQYDALVSFVFNIGCSAFKTSSVLRHLNAGEYEEAAEWMRKYIYDSQKVPRIGLANRRKDEIGLFNGIVEA